MLDVLLKPFGGFVNAEDGSERSLEKLVIKDDAYARVRVAERQSEDYHVEQDDKCEDVTVL